MSSSLPVMILLNLSGGTQDACSYFYVTTFCQCPDGKYCFNGVSSDLQNLKDSIRYFLPVAFLHWGYLWPV